MQFKDIMRFLLVMQLTTIIRASKVLIVFNHFYKSLYIQGASLGKGLASAGHSVVMASPFSDTSENKIEGYKEIVLDGLTENLAWNTNFISREKVNPFLLHYFLGPFFANYTEKTIKHEKFNALLTSNQTFDVIILGEMFNTAIRIILQCKFNAPMVLYNPFMPTTYINELIGNPMPPSYIPNIFLGFPSRMTFWERSVNFVFTVFFSLNLNYRINPLHNEIIKKYFPNCPKIELANKNISLILLNTHESVTIPIPQVPNMINVLGFHLKENNSLSNDLQQFMDNSKDGVILFSFGSFVNPSKMEPNIKMAFINSLGKLKQNILWKTNEENIEEKPKNIYLSQWLPQEDLLAHPNTKLFITHGGLTSTIETIFHGVPVLVVPLVGDQDLNAARSVEMGIGLTIKFENITEENLDHLFYELLNNKQYTLNAKKRSILLRDRPVKPMDLIVYWVEFVIRHRGAPHLQVEALELTWYQYLLLDVILGIIIVFISLIGFIYFVTKIMLRILLKKNKVKLS